MKKLTLIAIVVLVAFGCKKEEAPTIEPGSTLDIDVIFQVYDADGVDLLNPKNHGALNNIKLFEYSDGIERLIDNKNAYFSKGYTVNEPLLENKIPKNVYSKSLTKDWSMVFMLRIYDHINHDNTELLFDGYDRYWIRKAKIKIQWDETHIDVIEAEIKEMVNTGSLAVDKVWVNGKFEWEARYKRDWCVLNRIIK